MATWRVSSLNCSLNSSAFYYMKLIFFLKEEILSGKQKLGEHISMRTAPQDTQQGKGVLEIRGDGLRGEPGGASRSEEPRSGLGPCVPPREAFGSTPAIGAGPGRGPGVGISSWSRRHGAGCLHHLFLRPSPRKVQGNSVRLLDRGRCERTRAGLAVRHLRGHFKEMLMSEGGAPRPARTWSNVMPPVQGPAAPSPGLELPREYWNCSSSGNVSLTWI